MNRQRRFLANQVKDRVKQDVRPKLRAAECCHYCKHAQDGYFSDTVSCPKFWRYDDPQPHKTEVCDKFERRE